MANEESSLEMKTENRGRQKLPIYIWFPLGLIVSVVNAMLVFCVLMLSAWYNLRDAPNVCQHQFQTRLGQSYTAREIREYQQKQGRYPSSLEELAESHNPPISLELINQDDWKRPFQYTVINDEFTLVSLGRDGAIGGKGLDADIYHDDRNHAETRATFTQFFGRNLPGEVNKTQFAVAGFIAGVVIVFSSLQSVEKWAKNDRRGSIKMIAMEIAAITIFTGVAGLFLMPLHVPSGH